MTSFVLQERLLEQQQSKVMPSTVKKTKGQGESALDSFLVYLGVCVCVFILACMRGVGREGGSP